MNEVSFAFVRPVSAVPVYPATGTPGIWAAVPVPDSTTRIIIGVSTIAVSRFITRRMSSGYVRVTMPP